LRAAAACCECSHSNFFEVYADAPPQLHLKIQGYPNLINAARIRIFADSFAIAAQRGENATRRTGWHA
jgi:hypothetical protein